ncbi:MAG TPA: hypothetical protein VMT46_18470 [Anaerolineaceae bacterium]|nr:hypothetical protein [Anaerolineaceae bacterium]
MTLVSKWKQTPWSWAAITLAVAVLERWIFWGLYAIKDYNDTGTYRRLAGQILRGWSRYDGVRTPGYPLLLAWLGPDERVYVAQLALGIGITLLMFWIGWMVSGKGWFAALIGLAHTFNLGQLFFEASLMSETLATFWVILAVALTAAWIRHPGWRNGFAALGIGLAAACAALVRPLFLFLPVWLALVLALVTLRGTRLRDWFRDATQRAELGRLGLILLMPVVMIGSWAGFIHNQFGTWGVSTITGYHLIQHTGYYFEYVPDQYAKLRDTYIRYRDARIARYGTQGNAIWDAIPEMTKVSGLSFNDLSDTLAKISIQLIREHPDLYLHYAAEGWWLFWRAPVYWSADHLRAPGLARPADGIILAERAAIFGANLFFLASSIGLLAWRKARKRLRIGPILWLIAATVWVTSILQTLPDHGDNPRFLIPMQSLVSVWVLWVAVQAGGWIRERPVHWTVRPPVPHHTCAAPQVQAGAGRTVNDMKRCRASARGAYWGGFPRRAWEPGTRKNENDAA